MKGKRSLYIQRNSIFWKLYLPDQKYNILFTTLLTVFGELLFVLEYYRHPNTFDSGTMLYFIVLMVVLGCSWLLINYYRLKPYYLSIVDALQTEDAAYSIQIVQGEQTREQHLVKELLRKQEATFLDALAELKRKQEIQYHFTLQWVHQMKTPLSVIDMQLQEALSSNKHPNQSLDEYDYYHLFSSMIEEKQRIEAGLELMLNSARLDRVELDLHIRPLLLHGLTRNMINRYKRLFIEYCIYPKLVGEATAETDEKWFMFIMHQLMNNAIKYSKNLPGNKYISIEISQNDRMTTVKITDDGIGIAATDIKRIFDPFFTGENGRMTGESTGMGLYLTKQICDRLGHKLEVQSELHKGTTFTLLIPAGGIHRI